MDMDSKIMGKIGFNCQLHLNRAGFVLHEEDFVQHVLFDTGRRRTRLGIGKKRGEAEPSQDDTIRITPSSCAKDLTISEGTRATFLFNFHSRVPNSFS